MCQGPVELLLALGRWEPLRDLLLRVFANQNADGDWPQWFMFFDRERGIRPGDLHGDIVFWPVRARRVPAGREYASILYDPAVLRSTEPIGPSAPPVWPTSSERSRSSRHASSRARTSRYGHGDWNDLPQPVVPAMRERLCSSWTVTLHHQTLASLPRRCGASAGWRRRQPGRGGRAGACRLRSAVAG